MMKLLQRSMMGADAAPTPRHYWIHREPGRSIGDLIESGVAHAESSTFNLASDAGRADALGWFMAIFAMISVLRGNGVLDASGQGITLPKVAMPDGGERVDMSAFKSGFVPTDAAWAADKLERMLNEYALRYLVINGGDLHHGTVTVPGVIYTEGGSSKIVTSAPANIPTPEAASETVPLDVTMKGIEGLEYGLGLCAFGATGGLLGVGLGVAIMGGINAWDEQKKAKIAEDAITDRTTAAYAARWRMLQKHEDERPGQPFDDAEKAYLAGLDKELDAYHRESEALSLRLVPPPPKPTAEVLTDATTSLLTTALYIGGGILLGKVLLDTFLAHRASSIVGAPASAPIFVTPSEPHHEGV